MSFGTYNPDKSLDKGLDKLLHAGIHSEKTQEIGKMATQPFAELHLARQFTKKKHDSKRKKLI